MDTKKVLNLIEVLRNTLSSSANNDADKAGVLVDALMQVINDEIPTPASPVYLDTPGLGTRELIKINLPAAGANKLTPVAGLGKFGEILGTMQELEPSGFAYIIPYNYENQTFGEIDKVVLGNSVRARKPIAVSVNSLDEAWAYQISPAVYAVESGDLRLCFRVLDVLSSEVLIKVIPQIA